VFADRGDQKQGKIRRVKNVEDGTSHHRNRVGGGNQHLFGLRGVGSQGDTHLFRTAKPWAETRKEDECEAGFLQEWEGW